MILRSVKLTLCVLPLAFSGPGVASAAVYHVTDLGAASAWNVATVGGVPNAVGGANGDPVVWASGTPTDLLSSIPGATAGFAWNIDGGGDVVGNATVGGVTRAFYLPGGAGTATVLPVLGTGGMNYTSARAVNSTGLVVGTSSSDDATGSYHAFAWTASGGMVDLGGFPGGVPGGASPYTLSSALGLNANGQIVGVAYQANGSYDPAMWTYNGATWTITNLNPTHSVCHGGCNAWAVNDSGDAVGYGFAVGGIMPTTSAVLFQHDGTVVVLPGLGALAPNDHARGINDNGVIVGDAATASSGIHAFVYDSAGGEQDLNNLIVADGSATGWTLKYATGITNSGYISGFGSASSGATHAFLLTPVLPGDANEDGRVDINDLTRVLTNYNQSTEMNWTTGDFNGDNKVDINDLTIVLAHYNTSFGSPDRLIAVPEPSTLLLTAAGLVALLAFARRRR
jgi:probable HAF family extracellular repeat protein